jgi:hypothetical protein
MAVTVAVEPPSGTVLRAGYTPIWESSICMGFWRPGERAEGAAVDDRFMGRGPDERGPAARPEPGDRSAGLVLPATLNVRGLERMRPVGLLML